MISGDVKKDAWLAGVDGSIKKGASQKSSSRNAQDDRMMARAETMARTGRSDGGSSTV